MCDKMGTLAMLTSPKALLLSLECISSIPTYEVGSQAADGLHRPSNPVLGKWDPHYSVLVKRPKTS